MRHLLLVLSLLPFSAGAEVYKWVDDKGVVHYTDKPPGQNAKPARLPPLQTYKGGTTPDLNRYESRTPATAPAAGGATPAIEIVSPTQDQTFFSGESSVVVAVDLSLTEGQQLVYFLDGAAKSPPVSQTSYELKGVERGSHTVSVALIAEDGRELGRSAPVTIHMKPPSLISRPGAPRTPGSPQPPRQPR